MPRHHRRSIRLPGYDYTQAGAYFVTICIQGHECLLGNIIDGEMRLNPCGEIVLACWNDLPNHYANVTLDAFVVMPNHVHGIIVLNNGNSNDYVNVGAGLRPAPTNANTNANTLPRPMNHPLSEIVRAFKSFSARRINEGRGTVGARVWQRNYYEHIVRHDEALWKIRDYMANNALRWSRDSVYWEQH